MHADNQPDPWADPAPKAPPTDRRAKPWLAAAAGVVAILAGIGGGRALAQTDGSTGGFGPGGRGGPGGGQLPGGGQFPGGQPGGQLPGGQPGPNGQPTGGAPTGPATGS